MCVLSIKVPIRKKSGNLLYAPRVCVYIYIYIYIYIHAHTHISWPTIFEGDPNSPFLITTTQRCRGRHYSFPWIAPLTLDAYFIMLSIKQGGIKYHFLSFWYDSTWDWTPIYQTIGEHCNRYRNGPVLCQHIIIRLFIIVHTTLQTLSYK